MGFVTSETTMLSTMSTTKAVDAARKAAPWPGRSMTPAAARRSTATADTVPATRPTHAAVGVIRFQNMPRMNVANSGALKNPNSVCR